MTALAESGRSKLDVEISYSSSNPPPALSTAEFVNSKQEPPHEPQRTRHHKQQPSHHHPREHEQRARVGASAESQPSWSSRLRTVPLSIDFDVSVYVTQNRHGRLTLHPVLRTTDPTSAAPPPAAVQTPVTSRAVAQSLVFRGGGGGGQQGAEGDLGRNNCAKASVLLQCPPLGRAGCHHNQQSQQKMAETDISTATRASCSAAIGDTSAPSSACAAAAAAAEADASVSVNRPVTFDSAILAAKNSSEFSARCENALQRCVYSILQHDENHVDGLSLNEDGSCCSSLTSPSYALVEPSTQNCSIGRNIRRCYAAERINQNNRDSEMRLTRRPQQQTRRTAQRLKRTRCEDCQSAMLRYSAISDSSETSVRTNHRHPAGRSQYPLRDLFRVVHKLENLLDAINPGSLQGSETASAPSVTAAAATEAGRMATGVVARARNGDFAAATSAADDLRRRWPRDPRPNLDVTNLRHEYARLFRAGTDI